MTPWIGLVAAAMVGLACGLVLTYWQRRKLSASIQSLTAEARLRGPLLEHSADILSVLSRDGKLTYVTPSVAHILGWSTDTFTGKRWQDFVHGEDDDPFERVGTVEREGMVERENTVGCQGMVERDASATSYGGVPARLATFRMRHKNGHWVWIEAQVSRCPGQDADAHWLLAARNVTTRKRAEVAQIQAHAKLAQQASVDGLTSLFNRRHILAVLEKETARAYRAKQPLCVLLIDIDHFKPLNDYYGHQHGDSCLVSVAQCLSAAVLRPADVVGRYGGEEFMVILPDTDVRGMGIVAEKIRQSVEDLNLPHTASPFQRVTVSVGGVHIPSTRNTASERYIGLADNALYRAKRMGRNRVVCATESAQPSSSENVPLAPN